MIILKGNEIINLDNVTNLWTATEECGKARIMARYNAPFSEYYGETLCEYKSGERAQEIINDICDNYVIGNRVYRMPKE